MTEQKFTDREVSDQLLAHHEVGHFKACLAGDIPVDYIRVERAWFSDRRTGGYNRLGGSERRYWANDPEDFVRMAMCGRAAEEYWLERHPGNGSFRMENCGGDTAIMQEWIERHPELSAATALRSARAFVRTNWEWITNAAVVVLERDRVNRSQLTRAARRAS